MSSTAPMKPHNFATIKIFAFFTCVKCCGGFAEEVRAIYAVFRVQEVAAEVVLNSVHAKLQTVLDLADVVGSWGPNPWNQSKK